MKLQNKHQTLMPTDSHLPTFFLSSLNRNKLNWEKFSCNKANFSVVSETKAYGLPNMKKPYTSSKTRADAPPPPLQTPPTPYFPFFCLSTYNNVITLLWEQKKIWLFKKKNQKKKKKKKGY